ncbi:calcium-independent phospholipase A2-gamma-like isoform X2 [Trichomycterus rosablanca]|uniref:calcium-independent phospholipase A2-gamma-like isoform X2 n=1 Tax=Trichomycterus rosablanca TaxID=2290929 RepID=UPI002F357228
MTFRWIPDSYLLSLNRGIYLWHKHGQRFVTLLSPQMSSPPVRLFVKRPVIYRVRDSHHYWKHFHNQKSRTRRQCPCHISFLRHKLLPCTSISNFTTSACRGSNDLSYRMLRLKSTLKSLLKVVSGTQAEIFSKIARLKPGVRTEKEEVSVKTAPIQDQKNGPVSAATVTLVPQTASRTSSPSTILSPTKSSFGPSQSVQKPKEIKNKKSVNNNTTTVSGKAAAPQTKSDGTTSPPDSSMAYKQATPLFHPGSFSVSLDETYNYLAHHVNSYFGKFTMAEQKKEDTKDFFNQPSTFLHGPSNQNINHISRNLSQNDQTSSSPSSPKKSLGQYLAYKPTVQAFVGNYIAPLVPKFRTEQKNALAETEKSLSNEDSSKQMETAENKEQKAAEEKAKRLLLQREKIIARVSVDNRTRALVQALRRASDVRLYISRVEELSYHLLEFPETRLVAVKEKVIPCLLRLRQANDPSLKAAVREALTLVGYTDPVKSRGIRILTIDGGGTRGLVALQTLQKLEELSGKPIYQLFDYICGVSTGAILGFMLGVFHIPLNECEELYRKLGSDVFRRNVIVGTVKMGWSHAFYDSEIWEKVLKEKMGSDLLIETSRNPDCPKVAAVSTVVNRGTPLKAYVFRNYNLPVGVRSHYRGSCQHKLWEAIRASSAAPGYFQEFALGTDLHQLVLKLGSERRVSHRTSREG